MTVLGLADGTYNLSATTDAAVTDDSNAVPLDHSEVTLECDAVAETGDDGDTGATEAENTEANATTGDTSRGGS